MTSPRSRRSRRRRVLVAVLGAALLAGGLALAGQHRADRADVTAQARHAEAAGERFTAAYAPRRDVAASMLAPATDDWWAALTGFAAALQLPDAHVPAGARWIGYSAAQSHAGLTTGPASYGAVYVGFSTAAAAAAYNPTSGADGCLCKRYVRGTVVTLLDVIANPASEPFLPGADVPAGALEVRRASWTIDLAETVRQLTSSGRYRNGLRTYLTDLGLGGDHVTWTATAARPQGPWTGTLHGWDPSRVDVAAATAAIAATAHDACQGTVCETVDPGLDELVMTEFIQDRHLGWGDPRWGAHPDQPGRPLHAGVALAGGLDAHSWEGAATGTQVTTHGRLTKVTFQITDDGVLTMRLSLD